MTAAEARTRRLREFRMLIGAGVRPRDRLVLLGPTVSRPARLHRRLGFYRIEVVSCALHHDELTARFLRTRPDVLWVYPTSLKTVLQVADRRLVDIARPRILITSAQVMDEPLRRRPAEERPDLEIVDIYGSMECGRIAATRGCRDGLHVEQDALHLELLDGGRPVARGALGTSTVTVFDQLAMPFIRYEQGDLCRERLAPPACGRAGMRINAPIGRNMDVLVLPDGRRVAGAALDIALRDEVGLLQYRFVQTRPDHVRVELCYRGEPPRARFPAIRDELCRREGWGRIRALASTRREQPVHSSYRPCSA
jgi:phenylacetate-coenzyme A ligase PaaK-like adenylate-forming protein